MKKLLMLFSFGACSFNINAQDTVVAETVTPVGQVTVTKDPRLDILAKHEVQFNKSTVGYGNKVGSGYRLQVLSSNDRNYAMKVRSELLRLYPDQKVYMSFQAPFIKLKFGNFTDRSEAERYKHNILGSKLVNNNIYIVPELVELKVKADKNKDEEDN